MRSRGRPDDGFLLCFLFNLLYNYWWGAIALILWVLFIWLRIPIYLPIIGLAIWYGVAFISTLLVSWAVDASNAPTPMRENLNPYSAKNSDVFKDVFDSAGTPDETPDPPPAIAIESTQEDCDSPDENENPE